MLKEIVIKDQDTLDRLHRVVSWIKKFDKEVTVESITLKAMKKYCDVKESRMVKNYRAIKHHLLANQKYVCFYCGKYLSRKESTLDHKLPLSRGGKSDIDNFCVACASCNNMKSEIINQEVK